MARNPSNIRWQERSGLIECYQDGEVAFSDTVDHWINAVCRLLNLSDREAKDWVCSVLHEAKCFYGRSFFCLDFLQKLEILRKASHRFFKVSIKTAFPLATGSRMSGYCGHEPDTEWASYIGNDPHYAVIGCSKCAYGWLLSGDNPIQNTKENIVYNQEYFEGQKQHVGYGDYKKQLPWRIEKSRRLLRRIEGITRYFDLKVSGVPQALDIGSGYGFFRKVLNDNGWRHDGIEISQYAAEVCRQIYSYDTFVGTTDEYLASKHLPYDLITLWDVVEHLGDPITEMKNVRSLLKEDGICVIRTPNLMAAEREIFGPYYHSFRREHLHYFSPRSIVAFLNEAGLEPLFLMSESHFLSGFIGFDCGGAACLLMGSDIFVAACKKG